MCTNYSDFVYLTFILFSFGCGGRVVVVLYVAIFPFLWGLLCASVFILQFYDKFNIRHNIAELLEYLWGVPSHHNSWKQVLLTCWFYHCFSLLVRGSVLRVFFAMICDVY